MTTAFTGRLQPRTLGYAALVVCTLMAAGLSAFYLYSIAPLVTLPADILMWAEGGFIGDIIKLKTGVPFYTDPAYNNSMIYTPGAPLVTYAIAWAVGKTGSVVALRVIQLCFVGAAAGVTTMCVAKLTGLAFPGKSVRHPVTWAIFCFMALFLAATSPMVNTFAYSLHTDALALLISTLALYSVLRYAENQSWANLLVMAIFPAIGYLTKQFLISWSAVMFIFLLLTDPRDIKRLVVFFVVTSALIFASVGLCYAIWGDNFMFWTFEVMGGERNRITLATSGFNMSLFRSIDHVVRAWPEIAIGLVGAWWLVNRSDIKKTGPVIVVWVLLVASEALSSAAGWAVLYHFGPGVVVGMVMTLAGLSTLWQTDETAQEARADRLKQLSRPVFIVIGVATMFVALRQVPTLDTNAARYLRGRDLTDVHRYIKDIEKEFDGLPVEKVLIDAGDWVYLKHGFVQLDRAVSSGDQPPNGKYENIEMTAERLRSGVYSRVIVRDFDSPLFLYDFGAWERPSGVKKALTECFETVRRIPEADTDGLPQMYLFYTGPVSVFEPRPGGCVAGT